MDIDDKIRRGIKIAGWCMVALLLSPIAVVLAVRNLPPNAERQAALDLLHQPTPPVQGRDGSDAQWLLHYDVPVERQAEQAAKLRSYLARYDELTIENLDAEAKALPDPRKSLAEYPKFEGEPAWLCEERGLGCLQRVREDPAAAAVAVQANSGALDAAARMTGFDGVRWGLPPSFSQQLPVWGQVRRLVRTRHALEFVQGREAEAVAGLCRDIAGWRRLGADNDMLLASLDFAAYASQDLQLLSEMVAEFPTATSLPPECDEGLAATRAQELDFCPAMRTEFRSAEALYLRQMEAQTKPEGRKFVRAAVGRDHAVAVIAPVFAAFCAEAMRKATALDQTAASTHPPRADCGLLEHVGDPIGCWLAEMAIDYGKYQDRRTDLAAKIALMRTLAWARTQAQATQAGFDARPASLGLRRRPEVSANGREVSIPVFDRYKGDRFALQLAAPPRG